MEKIYSKVHSNILLNIIYRKADMLIQTQSGFDITPEKEFIQVRSLKAHKGKEYKAHKHKNQERQNDLTQESIIIISGSINVEYFDLDDSFLGETKLNSGDCIVTLRGGHAFKVLEDNTLFYENKNGPYNGLNNDKSFINGN